MLMCVLLDLVGGFFSNHYYRGIGVAADNLRYYLRYYGGVHYSQTFYSPYPQVAINYCHRVATYPGPGFCFVSSSYRQPDLTWLPVVTRLETSEGFNTGITSLPF
jgi:hypothetical protein